MERMKRRKFAKAESFTPVLCPRVGQTVCARRVLLSVCRFVGLVRVLSVFERPSASQDVSVPSSPMEAKKRLQPGAAGLGGKAMNGLEDVDTSRVRQETRRERQSLVGLAELCRWPVISTSLSGYFPVAGHSRPLTRSGGLSRGRDGRIYWLSHGQACERDRSSEEFFVVVQAGPSIIPAVYY